MKKFFILSLVFLSGCDFLKTRNITPIFENVYSVLTEESVSVEKQVNETLKLGSVSVCDMPLATFLSWVSVTYDITVICSSEFDDKPVTISVNDENLNTVLSLIARRVGVDVTKVGSTYYVGRLNSSDRGLLVRRVSRLTGKEIENCLLTVMTDIGKLSTFDDGLMVVGDRIEVLEKINKLIDDIQNSPGEAWVLQLYLISMTDRASMELGFDFTPAADVSLSFAVASGQSGKATFSVQSDFAALLKASGENSGVSVEAAPLFLLLDGGKGHFGNGQKIPVAKKTVSNEGTVSTTSYDYVDTGLQVDVDLRSVGNNQSRISLDIKLSDVVGYVEGAPIQDERSFTGSSIINSGGVYLLGSLSSNSKSDSLQGILKTVFSRDRQKVTIQIWGRCYRVGGPVNLGS